MGVALATRVAMTNRSELRQTQSPRVADDTWQRRHVPTRAVQGHRCLPRVSPSLPTALKEPKVRQASLHLPCLHIRACALPVHALAHIAHARMRSSSGRRQHAPRTRASAIRRHAPRSPRLLGSAAAGGPPSPGNGHIPSPALNPGVPPSGEHCSAHPLPPSTTGCMPPSGWTCPLTLSMTQRVSCLHAVLRQ
jgi:hypothetical protein